MILDRTVEGWLAEDIGHHDVTNDLPGETEGRLVAKEAGVVAGLEAARAVFEYLDCSIEVFVDAGDTVEQGEDVFVARGPARAVFRGERAAVNVVAHASGIATRTRDALEAAREVSEDVTIAGTRKTTPGLRGIEKRAIAAGGGDTHRLDLSHMAMVKDNHIAELGVESAIERIGERTSFATRIDVEVDSIEDAPRAAEAGADVILLDNMPPEACEEALSRVADAGYDDVLIEASGGISVESVPAYAATGVDIISMGSLTHSADALDLSFQT